MNADDYQKVKEIFNSAVEIGPADRGAFLDGKCDGEKHIKAEVERLLRSYDSEYLEQPAVAMHAEEIAGSGLRSGQQIGRYTILKSIGKGGMGEVYLADDRKLARQVALKILPEDLAGDGERLRRFEHEAQAASALNHPNILTIFEFAEDGKTSFIATEYVHGLTLREKISRTGLSISESLEVAIQSAAALDAAHSCGIVHRDIKPENIMVRDDGIVKVLDFGLAKFVDRVIVEDDDLSSSPTRKQLTTPGVIMGTVRYMSPEQTRGQITDARSDVWSLGCVMYEMLAGRPPFSGESSADVIAEIVKTFPASLSDMVDDIPERFDEIVGKTLEKEPDERYQTAKDLLIDLKRLKRKLELETEMQRSNHPSRGKRAKALKPAATSKKKTPENSSIQYIRAGIKLHQGTTIAIIGVIAALLLTSAYLARKYWRIANPIETRLAYAAKIKLAAQALETSNLDLVRQYLDESKPRQGETDLRGFEWGYLARMHAERMAMQPMMIEHTQVNSVAFSPDSKTLATAGLERIIRVWDVATGQQKIALEGHPGWLTSVAFSPDGTKIASGAFDRTPKIWDVTTGRELLSLKAGGGDESGNIGFSTFSPDGKLVVGGEVDRIRFWNAETLAEVTNFLDVRDVKGPFAFSGDGKMLAARWGGPGVKVFTIGTGKASSFTPVDGGGITGLDLSRDGSLLVTGDTTGIARLWDVKKGVVIKAFTGHQDWILDVAFSPNGKTFATGGKDATIRIWSVETLAEVDVLRGHTSEISALAYSPDGQRIASAGRDQDRVRIWNVPSGAARGVLRSVVKNASPLNFSPDGKTLAAVGDEKTVSLWDVETERPRLPLAGHDDQIFAIEFAPDGQVLATTGKDKKLKVWDLARARAEISFDIGQTSGSVAFGPDGKRIATAHWFEIRPVSVWDRSTGGLVCEAESQDKGATTVSFSRDGSTIATSGGGDSVRVRDATTCKETYSFGDPAGEHYGLYAPSGRLLSFQILNNGRSAKLFDVTAGKEIASFSHEAELVAADVTTDESRLFTGDANGLIKVWDMVTGQELLTLINPGGKLDLGGVAVSNNGTILAAIGSDGSIKLWRSDALK